MIYDNISNVSRYKGTSKWLDKAIEFLEVTDLSVLPLGRTEICGDKVFVNVMVAEASDESDLKFEIHRKYMDIQIDIEGTETIQIGMNIEKIIDAYNEETDFGTVLCSGSGTCAMGPGRFIVCMKDEPHKPGIKIGDNPHLKKCVLKVTTE